MILHVLGSGSGLPTARRDTTSIVVDAGGPTLVDCPGGVIHKLARIGIAPDRLRRLILTHDHTDHLYGLPHLVHAMAIRGDGGPLQVVAPAPTVLRAQSILDAFGLGDGPPSIDWRPVRAEDAVAKAPIPLHTEPALRISAAFARHGRATLALRFETPHASLGHSSDTLPSDDVVALCRGVDLLLHDCGGLHATVRERDDEPHSSAREAGDVGRAAGASALGLIHLGAGAEVDEAALRSEAEEAFRGPVRIACDGDLIRLPVAGSSATINGTVR